LKKLLVIFRNSPYSSIKAQEGIELTLLASSYALDLSVLFLGNGVLQLLKDQRPEKIFRKNLGKMLAALSLYEIKNIYVDQDALTQYQLQKDQLVLNCQNVNQQQISNIIHEHQGIINC
jgi:tRNA 2-thiouridine synthesizing protein C